MKQIEDNISVQIQNHFPQFYREQGNTFVDFVKEYYNWAQQTNNNIFFARNLLEYRDIDSTVDDFLYHYKIKYLEGTPTNYDRSRFNVKHSKDFYSSKGTERGTKLLLNRSYNVSETNVYFPGQDVIKPSDGEWIVPTYIEVSLSPKTSTFVGKTIVGSTSGASAFVEGVSRKVISGNYIDVLSLSNLSGDFLYQEIVTVDGDLTNCPKITGSLTRITINDSSRNFAVGDVVNLVSSRKGKQGKARIDSIEQSTGRVTFTLIDGGTGYRLTSTPVVAQKMLLISNKVSSNTYLSDFIIDETIYQPLANIAFSSSNATFNLEQLVTGANSTANVSTGRIVAKSQNTIANGSFMVIVSSGDWSLADRIAGTSALIDSYTDKTATGKVMGVNANAIGITNVVNDFTSNNYNFIRGGTSNVYANVTTVGTGTGASFNIGSLTDEETIFLNDDNIGSNNAIVTTVLTGTISSNATSPQVNGTSTFFTTELYAGAYIKIGSGNTVYQVNTVSNNTILNLRTNAVAAVANTITITSGPYVNIPLSALKYGFPKYLIGNSATNLNTVLTRNPYTIGTIASFSSINPGTGYNVTPFVLVRDDLISHYDRRDLHLSITNKVGNFTDGEELLQNFSSPAFTLQLSGSNTAFITNETITQKTNATSNSYGFSGTSNTTLSVVTVSSFSNTTHGNTFANSVLSAALTGTVTSNATSPQVNGVGTSFTTELAAGDFIKFSGNNLIYQINTISNNTILNLNSNSAIITGSNTISIATKVAVGLDSNTRFFVNTSISNAQISISRGSVINSSSSFVNVSRKTFNQSFTSGVQITGSTSGATADVAVTTEIEGSSLMGNNAIVNSVAGIVNGSISGLSVIDSGYMYEDGELVTIEVDSNPFVGTGYANIINQGVGEGYFKSTKGFLNSDKYIHDGDYYQFYSYEVQTGIPLDTYSETLKKLMHVAGTKLFGNVTKVSNVDVTINSSGVEIST